MIRGKGSASFKINRIRKKRNAGLPVTAVPPTPPPTPEISPPPVRPPLRVAPVRSPPRPRPLSVRVLDPEQNRMNPVVRIDRARMMAKRNALNALQQHTDLNT